MLWLNVVPLDNLELYFNAEDLQIKQLKDVFPWLAPTRTSEKDSAAMFPMDAHHFQTYWSMSRRIRLDFQNTVKGGCEVCGKVSDRLLQYYITKNYGINYNGAWKHPLSPYRYDEKQMPIPQHPQRDGIGYKYWGAIVLNNQAAPIMRFNKGVASRSGGENIKIWAYGYDMDNMKARAWYESFMPFYYVKESVRETFIQEGVNLYLESAKQADSYLYVAMKNLNVHIKTAKINFWQATEAPFYEILRLTVETLNADGHSDLSLLKEQWLKCLREKALTIFDTYADVQNPQAVQIQRLVTAKENLSKNLYGPKIYKKLGLEPGRRKQ